MTESMKAAALLSLTALVLRKRTTNQATLADACEEQALRLSLPEPPAPFGKAVQSRAADGQEPARDPLDDLEIPEFERSLPRIPELVITPAGA